MNMNRVGIFWDYENCAPPSGTPGYVVAERLRATCGAYGSVTQFRAYLELSAPPSVGPPSAEQSSSDIPCPTSPKTLALRSELQSSGVSLIDCPHNSRKNVADSMLACDLVCFALDNPTSQIPYANYLPTSPYSIPNTPFSAIFPAPIPVPKTTIVLISGDRDFAYPLAVLKARKYEVGLIVPPGGVHPALRAQATWVMNWKDVLEGGNVNLDGRYEATTSVNPRGRAENTNGDGQTNGFTPPSVQGIRRPSFASRRGSISSPRRGSVSTLPTPVPPPPHLATTSAVRIPVASASFSTLEANESASISFASCPLQSDSPSASQPFSTARPSRRPPLRRPTVKAGSRPPSRAKSRMGPRPNRSERVEQETLHSVKLGPARPHPLIVPVPLTSSPIGSAGPSLTGMSPRAGRPQTPPLFSTSPPPPAPPAPPPPTTPPTKSCSPPAKPPTPPRDALRPLHRPPIPHVATPRPPIPGSHQPAEVGAPASEEQRLDAPASTSTLVAPAPKPSVTVLQSLLPAATALRPPAVTSPTRPVLALRPSVQASNTSTLAPATPVTPPASPPLRLLRLQPVQDDTDGDIERSASVEKKRREKAKERMDPVRGHESHLFAPSGEAAGSTSKKGSMRLAVQVGMVLGGEEPSAISGVDSILRSYTERSPKIERDDQKHHALEDKHGSLANPAEQKGEANMSSNPVIDEDDEEEERFHETFLATFSRPPICSNAPRTPATVKLVSLELTTEENAEAVQGVMDHKRSRMTTPRPIPRTSHSLPTLIPIMQSLLAGVEGSQPIPSDQSDTARIQVQPHEGSGHEARGIDKSLERLYSRANSPTPVMPPPIHRRRTSPSRIFEPSDTTPDPLVEATYREFRFLISVLERCRCNGQERPLRSLIGAEFTRDVFEQVRATSFKDHVQRAVSAGVVSVGGGSVQGREWISLNRNWQGLGWVPTE